MTAQPGRAEILLADGWHCVKNLERDILRGTFSATEHHVLGIGQRTHRRVNNTLSGPLSSILATRERLPDPEPRRPIQTGD